MTVNNNVQKSGYQGKDSNAKRQQQKHQRSSQYNAVNRQSRGYDESRRNTRGNNSYGSYQNNKYQKDVKKPYKRETSRYDNTSYSSRNKHGGNNYGGGYNNSNSKYSNRVKTVETLEDIVKDISRIEKEIRLEIDIIKAIRFRVV